MFKIEITETNPVKKAVSGDWVVLSTKGDKSEYGYAPPVERTAGETRVVFVQCAETIDLTKIIKAINGLE